MPTDVLAFVIDRSISTLFGSALLAIVAIIWRLVWNWSFRPPEPFFGKFFVYQYSTGEGRQLVRGICEVRKTLLGGNQVIFNFEFGNVSAHYKGAAMQRRGVIYIHAVENRTEEEMTLIIREPIAGGIQCCVGIVAGLSAATHVPCATTMLLSKGEVKGRGVGKRLNKDDLIAAYNLPLDAVVACDEE